MGREVMIVTGASSALGQAILDQMLPDFHVVALGRTPVERAGVTWIDVDFRQSKDQWQAPVKTWLLAERPVIGGFCHAAGLVFSDHLEGTTVDEWDGMMRVNLSAAFYLGQLVSPYLASGARVVLVSSVDATMASHAGPAAGYGASKAGLYGLMRHWAAEWGPQGIRVNAVAPGALATGMGVQDDKVGDDLRQHIALGRVGNPEEVAAVVAFLLSAENSYMSGAWIPVDGGLNLTY